MRMGTVSFRIPECNSVNTNRACELVIALLPELAHFQKQLFLDQNFLFCALTSHSPFISPQGGKFLMDTQVTILMWALMEDEKGFIVPTLHWLFFISLEKILSWAWAVFFS